MQFGHNRDGKRDRPIVVYGVLADSMGRPLAVQAYAGNTGDPTTVGDQVEKIRGRFGPAGGAGGGPRAADRDADQPSEASSGTGVDLCATTRFAVWSRRSASLDERHLPKSAARTIPANGSSSATTRCWPSIGGRSGRLC